jgi:hypothetical protein
MGLPRRILCHSIVAILALTFLQISRARAEGQWDASAAELARKIIARTGMRGAMTLEVKNQSSLVESDAGEIRTALLVQLRAQGARVLKSRRPIAHVLITLSENLQAYLWVAEIRRGTSQSIAMTRVAKPSPDSFHAPTGTLVIKKELFYEQVEPMLDLAIIETPGEFTSRLLVLDTEKFSLLTRQGSAWTTVQSIPVNRTRPWPRDPRGRLIVRPDGQFEAYTPGTKCAGAAEPSLTMHCGESEEPWPLDESEPPAMSAPFAPQRNFFDGRLTMEGGQETKRSPFFAALRVADHNQTLGIFAGIDGHARVYAKGPDPVATLDGWGSDITAIQSDCAGGWQILASRATPRGTDSIQAFTLRAGVPTEDGGPVEFPGPVTALWRQKDARSALAVSHNPTTGKYEAFILSVSCSQ